MTIDPYANCNANQTFVDSGNCTLATCCLAQSNFNYIPTYGGNLFFAVIFGILILPQLGLGYWYKTWGFGISLILGLILEVVGYVSRVQLHDNPWSDNPFLIYLICLTIAPVFLTAAIYLCLTRILIIFGEHNSRVQPKWIAIGFMSSDFLSLVLQGAGGGIADTSNSESGKQTGVDVMIAGLVLQAISIGVFLTVCLDFGLRCYKGTLDMDPAKSKTRNRMLFKAFLLSLLFATLFIEIRSIYRVVELWGGFSGKLWNDETDFMVLDGAMCTLACLLLCVFHPGPAFGDQWTAANWSLKGKKDAGVAMLAVPTKSSSDDGGSGERLQNVRNDW